MRAELAARRRVLLVLAALLLSGLAGTAIGSQSPYVAAQQPDHLVAAPILHAGVTPQIWMSAPFCVATWFDGSQCAEHKGDEHGIGADWKLDLPPAWLTLVGRRQDGTWLLSAVSMANGQPPAPWFVAVSGPTLVTVSVNESPVTPSPSKATGTPPPNGATATGTSTPEPSPPGEVTPTPTHPIMTITPTPMFPELPTCATQVLLYWAGDPAQGGLGGKIGDVTWCESCNSHCGLWMLGVNKATMDGFANDARERVHQLWATVTVEAR